MDKIRGESRVERVERERASSFSALNDMRHALRNLGAVVLKVHQIVVGRLIAAGRDGEAEALNDWMKPLGDMLAHFEWDNVRDTVVDDGEV